MSRPHAKCRERYAHPRILVTGTDGVTTICGICAANVGELCTASRTLTRPPLATSPPPTCFLLCSSRACAVCLLRRVPSRLNLTIGGLDLSVLPAFFLLSFATNAVASLGAEVRRQAILSLTVKKRGGLRDPNPNHIP